MGSIKGLIFGYSRIGTLIEFMYRKYFWLPLLTDRKTGKIGQALLSIYFLSALVHLA